MKGDGEVDRLAAVLALVPFFAYYAACGLLGDTICDYSLAGLARDPLGQYSPRCSTR